MRDRHDSQPRAKPLKTRHGADQQHQSSFTVSATMQVAQDLGAEVVVCGDNRGAGRTARAYSRRERPRRGAATTNCGDCGSPAPETKTSAPSSGLLATHLLCTYTVRLHMEWLQQAHSGPTWAEEEGNRANRTHNADGRKSSAGSGAGTAGGPVPCCAGQKPSCGPRSTRGKRRGCFSLVLV